ncbi:MAG: DUF4870 domain-containing protein [Pedobacter sp.]
MDEAQTDNRNWATLCHLAGLAGYLFSPLGFILGPLIIWLIKRTDDAEVDRHGKEALNFQISMLIYGLAVTPLVFLVIGIPLLIFLAIFDFIMIIVAAVRCRNGQPVRYPLTIHFFT